MIFIVVIRRSNPCGRPSSCAQLYHVYVVICGDNRVVNKCECRKNSAVVVQNYKYCMVAFYW